MSSVIFSGVVTFRANEQVKEITNTYQEQVDYFESEIKNNITINESLTNELDNIVTQYNTVTSELDNINSQYQTLQNIIELEQTVDVIQARDNDVLIKTPDDKWLVIPMIDSSYIIFSDTIIETKYNSGESELERVDIFRDNEDDWSTRDSFTYTLPTLSINQNKMLSLIDYIENIDVRFYLYNNDQIEYEVFSKNIYNKNGSYEYLNVFENITPDYQFVTNQYNDGSEDIKISVIIQLNINDEIRTLHFTFDYWFIIDTN